MGISLKGGFDMGCCGGNMYHGGTHSGNNNKNKKDPHDRLHPASHENHAKQKSPVGWIWWLIGAVVIIGVYYFLVR
jgi:hypothetical protein